MPNINSITEEFVRMNAANASAINNAKKYPVQADSKRSAKLRMNFSSSVRAAAAEARHTMLLSIFTTVHRFSAVPAQTVRFPANTISESCLTGLQRKNLPLQKRLRIS